MEQSSNLSFMKHGFGILMCTTIKFVLHPYRTCRTCWQLNMRGGRHNIRILHLLHALESRCKKTSTTAPTAYIYTIRLNLTVVVLLFYHKSAHCVNVLPSVEVNDYHIRFKDRTDPTKHINFVKKIAL
jgi:hypothetical protein